MSWHFVELGSPALVAITYPVDERLVTELSHAAPEREATVRVKTWSRERVRSVSLQACDREVTLTSQDGLVWEGQLDLRGIANGAHELKTAVVSEDGSECSSSIRLRVGPMPDRDYAEVDHENALAAWSERGLLGTQLGPNKNGKKW